MAKLDFASMYDYVGENCETIAEENDAAEPNPYLRDSQQGLELAVSLLPCRARSITGNESPATILRGGVAQTVDTLPSDSASLAVRIEKLAGRLAEFNKHNFLDGRPVVGIGGQFSSGKSFFINSLISGDPLLQVDQNETTSIPTYIVSKEGVRPRYEAFKRDGGILPLAGVDAFGAMTHRFYNKYGIGFARFVSNLFILSPQFPAGVGNLAILDTPGYSKSDDGTLASFTDYSTALRHLQAAEFIIWLVSIENGTLQQRDIDFLNQLSEKARILVVVNKADKLEQTKREEVFGKIKESLAQSGIAADVVVYSSVERREYPRGNLIGRFLRSAARQRRDGSIRDESADLLNEISAALKKENGDLRKRQDFLEAKIRVGDVTALGYLSAAWRETIGKKEKSDVIINQFAMLQKNFWRGFQMLGRAPRHISPKQLSDDGNSRRRLRLMKYVLFDRQPSPSPVKAARDAVLLEIEENLAPAIFAAKSFPGRSLSLKKISDAVKTVDLFVAWPFLTAKTIVGVFDFSETVNGFAALVGHDAATAARASMAAPCFIVGTDENLLGYDDALYAAENTAGFRFAFTPTFEMPNGEESEFRLSPDDYFEIATGMGGAFDPGAVIRHFFVKSDKKLPHTAFCYLPTRFVSSGDEYERLCRSFDAVLVYGKPSDSVAEEFRTKVADWCNAVLWIENPGREIIKSCKLGVPRRHELLAVHIESALHEIKQFFAGIDEAHAKSLKLIRTDRVEAFSDEIQEHLLKVKTEINDARKADEVAAQEIQKKGTAVIKAAHVLERELAKAGNCPADAVVPAAIIAARQKAGDNAEAGKNDEDDNAATLYAEAEKLLSRNKFSSAGLLRLKLAAAARYPAACRKVAKLFCRSALSGDLKDNDRVCAARACLAYYRDERNGIPHDQEYYSDIGDLCAALGDGHGAVENWQRAGTADALNRCGEYYRDGTDGIVANGERAAEFFRQAAGADHSGAKTNLAKLNRMAKTAQADEGESDETAGYGTTVTDEILREQTFLEWLTGLF